jgi:membrane-associated phospholipid phosphatase/catechol 2,3-dioxygenase-like lactoylglutathione lyase family enzyme
LRRRTPILRAILKLDDRLFGLVARSKTPWLDRLLPSLSLAANRSLLWLGIAGALWRRGGQRGRRAALRGAGSLLVTSAIVNQGVKRVARRRRPSLRHVPAVRRLRVQPATTSFPSGHAASAFAFAVGASLELPAARVPLTTLASAVAYSRVYVGVHYPLDIVVGAAAGAALAYGTRLAVPVRSGGASLKPRLDHIGLDVSDYPRSKAFYEQALAPLGIRLLMEPVPNVGGFGDDFPFFWIANRDRGPDSGTHVAFTAADRKTVDAFHAAALEAGGRDNGAPGVREIYHPNYYGAFVLDPDGNNVEAVCHSPA